AKDWVARRKSEAPEITQAQRALLDASADAESARVTRERRQLEEMRRAQEATARSQKRAGWLLRGVALLVLAMLASVMWQIREVARREMLVFTSLAASAIHDEQFDRALRYALQGFPARGSLPWFTPHSTELEGKLGGAAA